MEKKVLILYFELVGEKNNTFSEKWFLEKYFLKFKKKKIFLFNINLNRVLF